MNDRRHHDTIGFVPDMKEQLYALEDIFRGRAEHGAHQDAPDDHLVAELLGWYFHQAPSDFKTHTKAIWVEFSHRQRIAEGEKSFPEELDRLRRASRGAVMNSEHLLTVDGIDENTLSDIRSRYLAVLDALDLLDRLDRGDHESTMQLLAAFSDQLVIDLSIYYVLSMGSSDVTERMPLHIIDEITARAYFRAHPEEFEDDSESEPAATTVYPAELIKFARARKIDLANPFWTPERLARAKEMGM